MFLITTIRKVCKPEQNARDKNGAKNAAGDAKRRVNVEKMRVSNSFAAFDRRQRVAASHVKANMSVIADERAKTAKRDAERNLRIHVEALERVDRVPGFGVRVVRYSANAGRNRRRFDERFVVRKIEAL